MERCVTDPDNGLLFLAVEVTDENSKSEKHKDLVIRKPVCCGVGG